MSSFVCILWYKLLLKIFQKVRSLLNIVLCVITLILVPRYSLQGGIEPTSESRSSHPDGRWRLALTSGCGQVQHK